MGGFPVKYVMFDPDLGDLVNGVNIDEAYNGVLLTHYFHARFGKLKFWFDATDVRDFLASYHAFATANSRAL
jgi:hypothetical protein